MTCTPEILRFGPADLDLEPGDFVGLGRRAGATSAFPGTPRKIAAMERRVANRQRVFHPDDAVLPGDCFLIVLDGQFGSGLGRSGRRKVGVGRALGPRTVVVEAPRFTTPRPCIYPSDSREGAVGDRERARDRLRKRAWRKKHPGKWKRKKREERAAQEPPDTGPRVRQVAL